MPRYKPTRKKRYKAGGRHAAPERGRLLSDRQERFINLYLATLDATKAYTKAGYGKNTKHAAIQAAWLIRQPAISAEIDRRMEAAKKKYDITNERILGEIARIGFSNWMDYGYVDAAGDFKLDLTAMTRDQAAALGELEYHPVVVGRGGTVSGGNLKKVKLLDKLGALKELAKINRIGGEGDQPTTHLVNLNLMLNMSDKEAAEAYARELTLDASQYRRLLGGTAEPASASGSNG